MQRGPGIAEKLALTQHMNTHEYTTFEKSYSFLIWDIFYEEFIEDDIFSRVNRPQKSTLNENFKGRPKGDMDKLSHPN